MKTLEFADEFAWYVPTAGFQWIASRSSLRPAQFRFEPMLVLADLEKQDHLIDAIRFYFPLRDEPALFRKFVDTPPTQDGILRFANLYGQLGKYDHCLGPDDASLGQWVKRAEPLVAWMGAILSMRQAIALWDRAMAGDRAELAELIRWESGSLLYVPLAEWRLPSSGRAIWNYWVDRARWSTGHAELFDDRIVLLSEHQNRHEYQRLHGDVVGAARLAMTRIVNEWLCGPYSWLRLDENLQNGRPTLRHWPMVLLDALWLQFATAVSENRRYRVCKECHDWFEIPLRGARITREYCSNACRSKAYRERQERARQLHVKGKSFKEIAKEFDTDVKTVRGWISQ